MMKVLKKFDVQSLVDYPDYQLPEETGDTFQENAILKAVHAAKALNKLVVSDDSGLVVQAIGGRPGVYSKRYAGEDATDADNRKKLLLEMNELIDERREAYFECCLALAGPQGLIKVAEATVHGRIATQEKGRHGFGYDPLFIKNDYDKTFAELDETTKNKISHRRKAFERLVNRLDALHH